MQESLEAILALFRAAPDERIDRHSDWFTLRDAQLHIRPYTWPYPEISTAAMISPSGPRLAGALGTSLLSLSMSVPGGYAALETTWEVVREQAAKAGRDEPDRADWRVLSIMHIADSREQAIDDCTYGLQDFANYFGAAGFVPLANTVEGAQTPHEFVEDYAAKGNCCIGTPDDAIAHIEDLLERSGGFGTLLMLGHDWASPEATYHCYDLIARKVIPHFKGQLRSIAVVARLGQGQSRPIDRPRRRGRREGHHRACRRTEKARRTDARLGVARRPDGLPRRRRPTRCPKPARCWSRVRACGICGSDLHFAAHGARGAGDERPGGARRGRHGRRPGPRHLHGPRIQRRSARGRSRHRNPSAGNPGHVASGAVVRQGRRTDRLQQQHDRRLRRADAAVGAAAAAHPQRPWTSNTPP